MEEDEIEEVVKAGEEKVSEWKKRRGRRTGGRERRSMKEGETEFGEDRQIDWYRLSASVSLLNILLTEKKNTENIIFRVKAW